MGASVSPALTREKPAAPRRGGRVALAVAGMLLTVALYAGIFVASRWSLLRALTPWDLAALRFGVAGLVLLPVLVRRGLADLGGVGWARGAVLALTAGVGFTLPIYAGLGLAPAGHAATITPGLVPVVSAGLARWWLGDRVRATRVAGLAVILAGVALIGSPSLTAGPGRTWAGDAAFALAGSLWGVFTVLSRRWAIDPILGASVVWCLSGAYVPLYLAVAGPRLLGLPPLEVAFQGVCQGLLGGVVALLFYTHAVRVLGATRTALFMPLVPLLGALMAIPTLGEVPTALQVAGMVAVSLGILVAALR